MTKKGEMLISCDALEALLSDPNLSLIDGSWYLPTDSRNPFKEYEKEHIPKTTYLNLEVVSDQESKYPHMAPKSEDFSEKICKLGINNHSRVVVYDSDGMFSAARIWWLFRLFGKQNVMILDGGLPKWKALGKMLTSKVNPIIEGDFISNYKPRIISNLDEVIRATNSSEQIIDARAPGRFHGRLPEPREGLKSGHIPGSKNIFYADLLNADKTFKKPEKIRSIFENANIDFNKTIITSCGSGVTAAILFFALEYVGAKHVSLYDGSWCEWGQITSLDAEI